MTYVRTLLLILPCYGFINLQSNPHSDPQSVILVSGLCSLNMKGVLFPEWTTRTWLITAFQGLAQHVSEGTKRRVSRSDQELPIDNLDKC